jgi:hypothetical protein
METIQGTLDPPKRTMVAEDYGPSSTKQRQGFDNGPAWISRSH